jgi:hypothetical protein
MTGLTLRIQSLERIRTARFSAVCALLGICIFVPLASAGQASSAGAGQEQPATAKPATPPPPSEVSSSASTSAGTTHAGSTGHRSSHKKKSARVRGQKKIDADRARAIQDALIREHYLTGEPTGTWNQASEEAMRRYQSDHGWQTKEVPDSRALISLGLGPSKDHLLNPDSAMTSGLEKQPTAAPTAPQSPAAVTPTPTPSAGDPPKPQ